MSRRIESYSYSQVPSILRGAEYLGFGGAEGPIRDFTVCDKHRAELILGSLII